MKKLHMFLLLVLFSCFWGCGQKMENTQPREEMQVKREFCRVTEITEEYLLLRNVYGDIYKIDISYNDDYELEEQVILSYLERTKTEDNLYTVTPEGLSRSDNQIKTIGY